MQNELQEAYGNIDSYLFDQLLKGRYDNCKKVLNPHAVETVRKLPAALAPDNSLENFRVCAAENLPYTDAAFDLIISSAVLHFATDAQHFDTMLQSMFRVLKPEGYFFARLASDIGIEHLVKPLGNNRYLLPDTSERFLANEQLLLNYTNNFGMLYEPIKTTNVQNMRCMTTWCVQKR